MTDQDELLSVHNAALVQGIDPLKADHALHRLQLQNAACDVRHLAQALLGILPSADAVDSFSVEEGVAAVRDLGMYLGSLKRCGVQPATAVPAVVPVLTRLARLTGTIPRDTVYHYTVWNPTGTRERTYTGDLMERHLIQAVRHSAPALSHAVDACVRLSRTDPHDPDYAAESRHIAGLLAACDDAMKSVLTTVSPEFFAQTLRPYFEDVAIEGRPYLGPAAAHLPLSLLDLIIWASDRADSTYLRFCQEVGVHTLPRWRRLYDTAARSASQVTRLRVARASASGVADRRRIAESAVGLSLVLKRLSSFRGKHLVMARRAYAHDRRRYELGSGGGSVDLLEGVLQGTREARRTETTEAAIVFPDA
ncbi:monodechloroaminopyrrolnitrin synthase PrnB family protein [Streptomyces sp. NPDC058701]|uniref:monodechloroaminopyrrolnitrin synthase PrnB family protein n=1 Tax=Streptomyces sp. NPDC058701 TaxID=3346608 RepID=UPI00365C441F